MRMEPKENFSKRIRTSCEYYTVACEATGMILNISAVTFAVRDMARSVEFYRRLGFELVYGGEHARFSSLQAGTAFVNLSLGSEYEHQWWGRAIFRVDDVDAYHRSLQVQGVTADSPQNAPWGERFFHLTDPD